MAFSSAIASRISRPKNIKNDVTVVGNHALTVLRAAAQLPQLTRHGATSHRNNFYRQREFAEDIDLL